ncbi:MAG: AmmeMemoRadiSam system protein B [Candidatus Heimdallarchaeaceae archaeon]
MTKRTAAVAGMFYPSRKDELISLIEKSFSSPVGPQTFPIKENREKKQLEYYVSPHAGYIYSGPIAAWTYFELSKIELPETVIILGPNHYGVGPDIATVERITEWETPLGIVSIDKELKQELVNANENIGESDLAHHREHSIEVQLPFLQYIFGEKKFKFVPIAMTYQSLESSIKLGQTIAKVCKNKEVIIIASSDLTHQEPYERAKEKDLAVLNAIEQMDVYEMYNIKQSKNVTMCGAGPIAATITAALETGRTKSKILKYASSGDTAGDKIRVVGYSSVKFYS